MELFGIKIEKVGEESEELAKALATLDKHGYRAVKKTADTSKKQASAKKASAAKVDATHEKIQNGLNLWRMQGEQDKKLTAYRLGKLAGVSQNTAKKYLESIDA